MLRPSSTVAANVDGVSGNETVYTTGGDLDIDRAGDEDADGNIIGDGKIDTRDVGAPSIVGDIKFGDDGDYLIIEAGTVTGQIDFGAGDEQLQLENSMADDPDDDYEAPYTEFRGTIKNTGNLNLTLAANSDVADEKPACIWTGRKK